MLTYEEVVGILHGQGLRLRDLLQTREGMVYLVRVMAENAKDGEQRYFSGLANLLEATRKLPAGWDQLWEELERDERYAPLRPLFDLCMDAILPYLASRRGGHVAGSRSKINPARKAAIQDAFQRGLQRELKRKGSPATKKDQARIYNAAVKHAVDHADPGGKPPDHRTVKKLCPNPFEGTKKPQ